MVLKTMIAIEVTKNDHTYTFSLPVGVPFGELYDAAHEVLLKIVEMAKESAERTKQNAPQGESDGG